MARYPSDNLTLLLSDIFTQVSVTVNVIGTREGCTLTDRVIFRETLDASQCKIQRRLNWKTIFLTDSLTISNTTDRQLDHKKRWPDYWILLSTDSQNIGQYYRQTVRPIEMAVRPLNTTINKQSNNRSILTKDSQQFDNTTYKHSDY